MHWLHLFGFIFMVIYFELGHFMLEGCVCFRKMWLFCGNLLLKLMDNVFVSEKSLLVMSYFHIRRWLWIPITRSLEEVRLVNVELATLLRCLTSHSSLNFLFFENLDQLLVETICAFVWTIYSEDWRDKLIVEGV